MLWDEEKYFSELDANIRKSYDIANLAKKRGIDFSELVESPLAMSMAEKCVSLIDTMYPFLPVNAISKRIIELEGQYGKLDSTVSFVIAKEVAEEKFCKFDNKTIGIDVGLRIGFSYLTLGVVASPLEGYTGLTIFKDKKGSEYFNIKFSGPIRSAGTTATCVFLMLVDYLRESFGYSRYVATNDEISRYYVECVDYNSKVSNLQYMPTEEELTFLAKNLPIQIDGDPTEAIEVSNFKNLERVKENRIRGGVCLVLAEGLAQKAAKGLHRLNGVKKNGIESNGWNFLVEYLLIHSKTEHLNSVGATYIKDLVAGRPVYGYPSRSGGFRFRYGKSRNSGFSSVAISPATMGVSDDFLSHGTQLKLEKPIKGAIITSCDKIDGPIVKLKDGSVKKLNSYDESLKYKDKVSEIIYLGDILCSLGDVKDRNSDLLKPGYVEEWWSLELQKKIDVVEEKVEYDKWKIDFNFAVELSRKYSVPLHPKYIFYWNEIKLKDFKSLLNWLKKGIWRGDESKKFVLPWGQETKLNYLDAKRTLELIGVEHNIVLDNVVLEQTEGLALFYNVGVEKIKNDGSVRDDVNNLISKIDDDKKVLENINIFSNFVIKDKSGDFIGARMGRPEKAKLRKQTGNPNGLFSVKNGGRQNDVFESANSDEELKNVVNNAMEKLGYNYENFKSIVKGVKEKKNDNVNEYIGKGILRSKYNLSVNKDGTIRYDGTEIPLTHFKPKEIGVSLEKLIELGYNRDILGKELVDINQILELRPHDIVLAACSNGPDEKANDVFFNIANFIDEELDKIYGGNKFYNFKTKEDLIGQLVVCMAPHNCAGVVGRIIGFSNIQGIMASPYMHAAIRRDCDGDEMAVMMLMDVLLNFSRSYLPSHRGASQDAPLVLNGRIFAGEVDDQILEYDVDWNYPLNLYEFAEQRKHSSEIENDNIKNRLKEKISPFVGIGFTHDSDDFNVGVSNGSYKSLPTMKEKVDGQMKLVEKIRAVDSDDVARMIIEKHFMKDIRGNLQKFFRQQFRCSSCNEKYRRPPLSGVCKKCGSKLLLTISYGSIKKYLQMALDLAEKYNISEYTKDSLFLLKDYIENLFGVEKQLSLNEGINVPEEEVEQKENIIIKTNLFNNKDVEDTKNIKEVIKEVVKEDVVVKKEKYFDINNNLQTKEIIKEKNTKKIEKRDGFVHLHLHTEYSFLDGAIKVKDLFNRVKELGMDSVAITEHGNMESMINKYKEAKKAGVKLIFGTEFYIVNDLTVKDKTEKRGHLVLLAKNEVGLKNLIKLNSIAACHGFYYRPRIDLKVLKDYSDGLICTSACLANDIARAIVDDDLELAKKRMNAYLDIFGKEDFYLEVHNHNIPEEKKVRDIYYRWADEMGLKLVAACDAHYLLKEDKRAHEVMLCIQTNGNMDDPNHFHFNGDGYYVLSEDEMKEKFSDRLDAVYNSVEIAERCNVDWKFGETVWPKYDAPGNMNHEEYMGKLCFEKLEKVYGEDVLYEDAKKRLEYELSVIKKMGFSTYFLIVQDFIAYAKTQCQVGPGRGSGAGSIVAYLLGITQLEPLHLGLLFERFLNPDRISLPDFDVDFGDRDVVINYVKRKYGDDKIALIGTYGSMSAKSVLKDVMRVFNIPFNVANEVTKYVGEKTIQKSLDSKDDKGKLTNNKLLDFKEGYPEIFEIAMKLEGGVRHKGVHACGVVWGEDSITEYIPVCEKDGFIVAQADGHEIEARGLVKFDFLGLETLNITKKILDFIGKDNEWLENIPLDDTSVYEMLGKGDSVGVFQLESSGMQKTLTSIGPTCFDDIIAIVALYRPGPMQYLQVYADRKHGREKTSYPHPWAKEILNPTYGIMVYQEQVMQLAQKLAGFTMAEADTLRKAIGKKILELMNSLEKKFKDGCLNVAKMEQTDIDKLWEDIVKFASYSFNKSHAAAYALIAYRTAYLKKYYPVEFMASTISSNTNDPEKMSFYLEQSRKMGIKILGPDINYSVENFNVEKIAKRKFIRFGLSGIKNVGHGAMDSILANRPYESFQKFVDSVDLTKVNKRVMRNLIGVGCFDNFGCGRGELLATYDGVKKKKGSPGKQMTLFGKNEPEIVVESELSLRDKIELERELMGVCISCNPVDLYIEAKSPLLNSYDSLKNGEEVSLFGVVKMYKKIRTKNGEDMAFLTIGNRDKECDCVIFPKVFEEFKTSLDLKDGDGIVVVGRYNESEERGNSIFLNEITMARIVK